MFETWWSAVSGYFAIAASVLSGNVDVLPILAALGVVALVAGIALILAWRVKRLGIIAFVGVAALFSPLAVSLADSALSWIGMLFAALAGAIVLVIGTAVAANNAERRLPIWLIGLFLIDFSFFAAYLGDAFVSLTV